jgi:hypothetical protein
VTMSLAHHTESGQPLLHSDNLIEGQGQGQAVVLVDESNLKRDRFVYCNNKVLNKEPFVIQTTLPLP